MERQGPSGKNSSSMPLAFLVRNGDEQTVEVADPLQPADHVTEILRRDQHREEYGVQTESGEKWIQHPGGLHRGDRLAEDGVEPGRPTGDRHRRRRLHRHFVSPASGVSLLDRRS